MCKVRGSRVGVQAGSKRQREETGERGGASARTHTEVKNINVSFPPRSREFEGVPSVVRMGPIYKNYSEARRSRLYSSRAP